MNRESPTGQAETLDDAVDQGANTPDDSNAADSSTAGNTEDAKSSELDLEAVIRKAAEDKGEDAADSSTDGKGDQETKPADPDPDAKPEDKTPEQLAKEQEEADAKLPFHKHPRWREINTERKQFKEKVGVLEAENASLKPKAEQLDRIGDFMRSNELTAEEMQQGFEIMALMKHNPTAALEKLMPHLDVLELAAGRKLPKDLQERVDAGEVTQEIAQETARARMDAQLARSRVERTEQTIQQDRAAAAGQAMKAAVNGWEQNVKATDPDYPHMQSFIVDRTRVLMQQTPPRTPDEAVALAKRAYDDVKASLRKVMPQKTQVRTVTSDKSSTTALATPSTFEDVVRMAIQR